MKSLAVVALIYNGLFAPEMGDIAARMEARGQHVEVMWHDEESNLCPPYLLGHSMGANAALRQAARCAALGSAPRAVLTIDPGRAPLAHTCPPQVRCINWYDPSHPIGGQEIANATNIKTTGCSHLELPHNPAVVRGIMNYTAPDWKWPQTRRPVGCINAGFHDKRC